jgi:hypothetical protein
LLLLLLQEGHRKGSRY